MRWSPFRLVSSGPARSAHRPRLAIAELEDRSVPSVTVLSAPRPAAASDWTDTDGTTPVTIAVLNNDTPATNLTGGPVAALVPGSVQLAAGAHHGKAVVNHTDGSITYTAKDGFVGVDTFAYTVRDAHGVASKAATVTVRVNGPVAGDDWTDTDGTNPVAINVLENDADPDGNSHIQQPGSVSIVKQPTHGSVTVDSNNVVTYTANAGFGGTDSFLYTVTDDAGATSAPAKVLIRINRPTANDDFANFGVGQTLIDVLANDTDPDGNDHLQFPGSVTVLTQPKHGVASVDSQSNEVTYTPAAGFTGTDSFTYTVTDDAGATSAPATITVVGHTPSLTAQDFITDTDGRNPVSFQLAPPEPLTNNAGVTAITKAPAHGTVRVVGQTGAVVYKASAGFGGTDSFKYRLRRPDGTVQTGTVSVVVNRPVANDDWTDTDAGNPVTFNVLANDGDPDGSDHINFPGSVKLVGKPAHGKVSVDPQTNAVTYTPAAGWGGTDSFKYTVTDDAGATSAPALAFVRVNRPTAAADEAETNGTTPVAIDVLENDTDPDGNGHIQYAGSVTILKQPAHGTVTVDPQTNQVTYTAKPGFVGTDAFTYFVTDDAGAASAPATVNVLVRGPVAASGRFLVTDFTASLFLLGSPPPGGNGDQGSPTITIVSGPKYGSLAVDPGTGKVTYTGAVNFRQDSFVYTVTDANGVESAPATITLIAETRIL